jgi:hypothetical protein
MSNNICGIKENIGSSHNLTSLINQNSYEILAVTIRIMCGGT